MDGGDVVFLRHGGGYFGRLKSLPGAAADESGPPMWAADTGPSVPEKPPVAAVATGSFPMCVIGWMKLQTLVGEREIIVCDRRRGGGRCRTGIEYQERIWMTRKRTRSKLKVQESEFGIQNAKCIIQQRKGEKKRSGRGG